MTNFEKWKHDLTVEDCVRLFGQNDIDLDVVFTNFEPKSVFFCKIAQEFIEWANSQAEENEPPKEGKK